MIFKCLGSKVGFLSGARMIDPDTRNGKGGCTRPNTVRLFFCLSTIIVIIFTVLLVAKGLTNLKNTTNSLDKSNIKIANILDQFQGIATDLRTVGANANLTRAQIVNQLNNFCPNNPNLAQLTGVNVQAAGQSAVALLKQLGDFISADVANAQKQLTLAQHTSYDLHNALDKFDFKKLALAFIVYVAIYTDIVCVVICVSWSILGERRRRHVSPLSSSLSVTLTLSLITLPHHTCSIYIVLPTIMMLGVLLAWFGFSNPCICCMLSWLVLPMWLIMTIVAVFCAAMTSWMVIANADFCSGGQTATPDATVKEILANRNVTQSSFIGQVTYFYVTQCMTSDPWAFLRSYQANLVRWECNRARYNDHTTKMQSQIILTVCTALLVWLLHRLPQTKQWPLLLPNLIKRACQPCNRFAEETLHHLNRCCLPWNWRWTHW